MRLGHIAPLCVYFQSGRPPPPLPLSLFFSFLLLFFFYLLLLFFFLFFLFSIRGGRRSWFKRLGHIAPVCVYSSVVCIP